MNNLKRSLGLRYAPVAKNLASNIAGDIHQVLELEVTRQLSQKIASDAGVTAFGARLGDFVRRFHWQSRIIKWATIGNVFICVFASVDFRLNPYARILLLSSGAGSILVAKNLHQSARSSLAIASTLSQIEAAEAMAKLSQITKPVSVVSYPVPASPKLTEPTQEPLEPELKLFDWKLLETKPDKYPHLAIVGSTGDGKTYTAESLCKKVFSSARNLVLAPHAKPTDWKGFEVFCQGRNYGSWEDEAAEIRSLKAGQKISVASIIRGLELEMDRRYKLYEAGDENYQPINVIWDETLAALDLIEELAEPMRRLLREARKVRIRLIMLLQDDSVVSLKIQGQGNARKNLTYLRLGEFATDYARKLRDEKLIQWLSSQEYPCMVEKMGAVIS